MVKANGSNDRKLWLFKDICGVKTAAKACFNYCVIHPGVCKVFKGQSGGDFKER